MIKNPGIENFYFFGLKTTRFSKKKLLGFIDNNIKNNGKLIIYGYSLALLWMIKKYPQIYYYTNESDIVLCDGHIYYILLKILKYPILDEISIPEMVMLLLDMANKKGYSILLFGADEDTNQKASKNIKMKYKNIKVLKGINGYFNKNNEKEIIRTINNLSPDILFIGISSPIKEKFAIQNKHKINSKIIVPCGGMIDVLSGKVKKSPKWLKRMGMASIYRIIQEPIRLSKRYFNIYYFFFLNFLPKLIIYDILLKKEIDIFKIIINNKKK